jgi:N-acyl homoserine lactone hydrolase
MEVEESMKTRMHDNCPLLSTCLSSQQKHLNRRDNRHAYEAAYQTDGGWDLFGDGTIKIIRTIGHSQGHQSAVVKLPKTGTLILTGYAAFMDDNLKGVVPGIVWSLEKAMESIERIKWEKERSGGAIWFSHDPDFFKTLRLVPEYYE